MGKMNTAMCSFLSSTIRFADFFNGVLFQGREIIQASDLQTASEQYSETECITSQSFRDIKMYMGSGETLRVLALENQNSVDYTLPYRCMQYDAMEYGRQLKELKQYNNKKKLLHTSAEWLCGISKNDRLAPVYTLCLYHGEDPWDGPLTLRDMMRFDSDRENLQQYFADYPLRLYCVNAHTDFSCFHTELREVFTALNCRKEKSKLFSTVNSDTAFQKLNHETVKVLSVLLNTPTLWTEREKFMNINQGEEEYNMCQALQELYEDGRNEGLSQGLSQGLCQGVDLMNLLVQKLLANNQLDDLKKAVADPAFRDELMEKYHLKTK